MEFGLEVEGKKLGALGFDDEAILFGDAVLEAAELVVGVLVAVVEAEDEADFAGFGVDGGDLGEDAEAPTTLRSCAFSLDESHGERGVDPVVVTDEGCLAGAVGVGLPNTDFLGFRAGGVGAGCDFVVFDFAVLRVAEQAGVNEAEMGDVEEVFHDSRAFGVHAVGTGVDGADAGLVGEGKGGELGVGFAEGDPDDAVALHNVERLRAGLGGRGEAGMGGNVDALAGGRVFPGVIRADQAVGGLGASGVDGAEGKLCAAVDAEVSPAVEALLRTPEDQVGGEETAG